MPRVFPNVEDLTRERIENVKCEIIGCGKFFKHSLALRFHKVKVHKIIQSDLDRSLIWKGGDHAESSNNQYHCPYTPCRYHFTDELSKAFTSFRLLRQHYNSVHRDKRHKCLNCSWMFSRKGDLRRHLTSCEEQTCASCRVRMANRKSLEKHCRMLDHQLPTSLQSSGTFSLDVKKNSAPLDATMKKKDSLKEEKSLKKIIKNKKEISILPKQAPTSHHASIISPLIPITSINTFMLVLPTISTNETSNNSKYEPIQITTTTTLQHTHSTIITNINSKINNIINNNNIKKNNIINNNNVKKNNIINNNNIKKNNINNNTFFKTNNLINNNFQADINHKTFPKYQKLASSSLSSISSSSLSSSASPLYKAVEIQTMRSSKRNKRSQGSQVVTKAKKSCLTTEHHYTQTTPPSSSNLSFLFCPDLSSIISQQKQQHQQQQQQQQQPFSFSSFWNEHPKLTDCQTQTLHLQSDDVSLQACNEQQDSIDAQLLLTYGCNSPLRTPFTSTLECPLMRHGVLNNNNNKNDNDNDNNKNSNINNNNKLNEINNLTNSKYDNSSSITNPPINTRSKGTQSDEAIVSNGVLDASDSLVYGHQQQQTPQHEATSSSTHTQTSFLYSMDDLQYLTEHLLPSSYLPPHSECLTTTETQTTDTNLPDFADFCDLLDTADITTQTPLLHFNTEEAHTQTCDFDFSAAFL